MNLENNSKDMATVVETYFVEENVDLIYDGEKLDKWQESVKALGLEGQQSLQKPDKSPIPFMHLKKSYLNILETLLPRKIEVTKFNITPIPLEIIDLIALSKKEEYFQNIYVMWDDASPDPAVIGETGYWCEASYYSDSNKELENKKFKTESEVKKAGANHPTFRSSEKYLIGKWGDAKQSFDELRDKAVKLYKATEGASITKEIKKLQRRFDDLEQETIDRFYKGDSLSLPF